MSDRRNTANRFGVLTLTYALNGGMSKTHFTDPARAAVVAADVTDAGGTVLDVTSRQYGTVQAFTTAVLQETARRLESSRNANG